MAPEVLASRVGPEADVWAAGVMAYQLLTGRFPFDDKSNPGRRGGGGGLESLSGGCGSVGGLGSAGGRGWAGGCTWAARALPCPPLSPPASCPHPTPPLPPPTPAPRFPRCGAPSSPISCPRPARHGTACQMMRATLWPGCSTATPRPAQPPPRPCSIPGCGVDRQNGPPAAPCPWAWCSACSAMGPPPSSNALPCSAWRPSCWPRGRGWGRRRASCRPGGRRW